MFMLWAVIHSLMFMLWAVIHSLIYYWKVDRIQEEKVD